MRDLRVASEAMRALPQAQPMQLRVKIAQLQRAKDGVEGASEGDSDALRNGVVKMRKQ
jgi:hypothetical protein